MKLLLGIICALVFAAGNLEAAVFLKLGDIKGESTDKGHAEEIEVLAWSWGMSNSTTATSGGGSVAGKAKVEDLAVTKWTDRATPLLLLHTANGRHIPEAVLTVRKEGEVPMTYLRITMTEVVVTSVSTGGSAGEDRLVENITLNFAEVHVEYIPQKADGSADTPVQFGWNIAENVAK